MKNIVDPKPPFNVGARIASINLMGWNYVGLAGIPDQENVSRRYVNSMGVLALLAFSNIKRSASVLSMKTEAEDKQWQAAGVQL